MDKELFLSGNDKAAIKKEFPKISTVKHFDIVHDIRYCSFIFDLFDLSYNSAISLKSCTNPQIRGPRTINFTFKNIKMPQYQTIA